jgi:hypothetical protein
MIFKISIILVQLLQSYGNGFDETHRHSKGIAGLQKFHQAALTLPVDQRIIVVHRAAEVIQIGFFLIGLLRSQVLAKGIPQFLPAPQNIHAMLLHHTLQTAAGIIVFGIVVEYAVAPHHIAGVAEILGEFLVA